MYSHNLSEACQIDKMFALEAMHDIRINLEWRYFPWYLKSTYKKLNEVVLDRDYSYFRKTVRPNELFIIINTEDILNDIIFRKLCASEDSV
jgi:hypothetical protein